MSKKKIAFLILGVLIVLGIIVKVNEEKSEYRKVMEDAVYIKDITAVDESLEGKQDDEGWLTDLSTGVLSQQEFSSANLLHHIGKAKAVNPRYIYY